MARYLGRLSAISAALASSQCEPGEYEGSPPVFGDPTCLPCAKGQYADAGGSAACKACPVGKFATGWASTSCGACPEGQISLYIDMDVCVDAAVRANTTNSSAADEGSASGLVGVALYKATHRIEQYSQVQKLGASPFLLPQEEGPDSWNNPGNVQASVSACQDQCMGMHSCLYGTYITDGDRKGECWLAAQTVLPISTSEPCGVPCISFRKTESSTGKVAPYMSAKMIAEQEQSEADQLAGVTSTLGQVHDAVGTGSAQVKSLVSKLHSEQTEMTAQMETQKLMLAKLKEEQQTMEQTMSAQLQGLHAGHAQISNKVSGHQTTLQGLASSQKQLESMLVAAEQKILQLSRKTSPAGLNYTALEMAIDAHHALASGIQSQDAQDGIESDAAMALALDQAHLHAVAKAGGFEHFQAAGLICSVPPVPSNGYTLAFSDSDRVVGGKVRFACNFGYHIVGSAVRKCTHGAAHHQPAIRRNEEHNWSGEPTFCEVLTNAPTTAPTPVPTTAPTPPPTPAPRCSRSSMPMPLHALISGVSMAETSYPAGTEVYYHCEASFTMIGRALSECGATGWSVAPTCADNVRTCSHMTCVLRRTHEVRPGYLGYHLVTRHHRLESRGTHHKCAYRGNTNLPHPDLTDCTCICWGTSGDGSAVMVT